MLNSKNIQKSKEYKYYLICSVTAVIVGTIFHFAYDVSNNSLIIGLFTPVNESVWEHLKLVALPLAIFATIHYIFKKQSKFLETSTAIVISSLIILFTHYFFEMLNIHSMSIDILSYILAMLIAFYYISKANFNNTKITGIIFLVLIILTLGIFTVYPPKTALFLDKTTNTYGISFSKSE